jgi:hypothetical protein
MSRVGKQPVAVANGIDVSIDGTALVAKKGNLEKRLETHGRVGIAIDGNEVTFSKAGEAKREFSFLGNLQSTVC